MARRRSAPRVARWLPWSPAMAAFFRLAKLGDWSPPAEVRLTGGLHRQTLSARFTAKDGAVMTARLRLARDCVTGERYLLGEELQFPTMILTKGAAE